MRRRPPVRRPLPHPRATRRPTSESAARRPRPGHAAGIFLRSRKYSPAIHATPRAGTAGKRWPRWTRLASCRPEYQESRHGAASRRSVCAITRAPPTWSGRGMCCAHSAVAGLTGGLRGAMVALRNILVATDFSEPSNVALAYGRDLARNYNARLHVMHVVEDVTRYGTEIGMALPALQEDLVKVGRRDLDARLTEEDRRQLNVVAVTETGANIAAAICGYAKNNAIDLIVTRSEERRVGKECRSRGCGE